MKAPSWEIDFKVDLYALKEYKGWTDEELGKRPGRIFPYCGQYAPESQ